MIRITCANNELKSDYNGKWRESNCAQELVGQVGQNSCSTPQSDIDAIADAMDKQEEEINNIDHCSRTHSNNLSLSPKENDISAMMQNYIRQNGGIVQDDKRIKKNQTLLG